MSDIIEKLKVIIEKQTIELKVSSLLNVKNLISYVLDDINISTNVINKNMKLFHKDQNFDDNTGSINTLKTNNNNNYILLKKCVIKFLEDNISTFQYKPIYKYITLKVNTNTFLLITLSEETNSIEIIEQWG